MERKRRVWLGQGGGKSLGREESEKGEERETKGRGTTIKKKPFTGVAAPQLLRASFGRNFTRAEMIHVTHLAIPRIIVHYIGRKARLKSLAVSLGKLLHIRIRASSISRSAPAVCFLRRPWEAHEGRRAFQDVIIHIWAVSARVAGNAVARIVRVRRIYQDGRFQVFSEQMVSGNAQGLFGPV